MHRLPAGGSYVARVLGERAEIRLMQMINYVKEVVATSRRKRVKLGETGGAKYDGITGSNAATRASLNKEVH